MKILDFDDFAQCIRHRNVNVLVMNFSDFYHLKVQKSDSIVKRSQVHLADMRSKKFCRDDRTLYYKEKHSDVEYKRLDFLMQKCKLHVIMTAAFQSKNG